MKNEILIIVSLIFLCAGVIGVFYATEIAEKLRIKKKINFVRVSKAVGLVLATIALVVIYILGR